MICTFIALKKHCPTFFALIDTIISNQLWSYSITVRDAIHIISGKKIENDFINCKLNGEIALDNLVSKFIYSKPSGSIEKLRKELNLKKILIVGLS